MSTLFLTFNSGCDAFLEVESLTRMPADRLLSTEAGLNTLLANMYNGIPVEDFAFRPTAGFNRRGWQGGLGELATLSMYTDESVKSDGGAAMGPGSNNMWSQSFGSNNGNFNAWNRSREISIFQKSIQQALDGGIIDQDTYNRLKSESHFARAYVYFALAKRFGGVPIIDWLQDDDYTDDASVLLIPRNTESRTWRFILEECDKAAEFLPTPEEFRSGEGDPRFRATKWAAYALKSRAALHAASLAKFGDKVQFQGAAVDQGLVGINQSEANFFYQESINASLAIIQQSTHTLYMPNPANPEEAAINYQYLFMNAPVGEVIFGKSFISASRLSGQGHSFDIYYSPAQAHPGFHVWGRKSPTLDLVDLYEEYDVAGTGASAPIVTRTDGNESYHIEVNNPTYNQIAAIPFVHYDNPLDPFRNKDARLHASVILPGSSFRGVTIVMQGGLITSDGRLMLYQRGSAEGLDGEEYYTYGAQDPTLYSGFAEMASYDNANYSSTGFSIRKLLAENRNVPGTDSSSDTDWIDFRLGEIYLNYAEAVLESGIGDQALAAQLLNALRTRAGHTNQIPLTIENVLKERRVELAFENIRMWDLWRRREYHELFTAYKRKSLVPLLDLRENPPKYVFLRIDNFHDSGAGHTFNQMNYYFNIPGVDVSGLINNPGRE